jgi:hypothetical protein
MRGFGSLHKKDPSGIPTGLGQEILIWSLLGLGGFPLFRALVDENGGGLGNLR